MIGLSDLRLCDSRLFTVFSVKNHMLIVQIYGQLILYNEYNQKKDLEGYTMKHIIVDLEMNKIAKRYKEERFICHMEIIEIGAVVLDEAYTEIGSFKTLVKPQFNDIIDKTVAKITGITSEMLVNAPFFDEALNMFFSWCHSLNDDLHFYQWSDSDLSQIVNEICLKKISLSIENQDLLSNWDDFQKEYGDKLMLKRQVSLKNAVMYAGIEFEGQEHDALWDARNTAALLRIIRDPYLCKETLDHVINILTPAPLCTNLGDLFDFNNLFEVTA